MNKTDSCEFESDRISEGPESNENKSGTSAAFSVQSFLTFFVGSAILILGLSWFFFDDSINTRISNWLSSPDLDPTTYSLITTGLLALDLVLPIPSSAVIAHAGLFLGTFLGTLIGFVGLTLGSVIGFGLTRFLVEKFGQDFIKKRIKNSDYVALDRMTKKYGVYVVVALRPIPILAEASVLLLAAGRMSWQPFLIWLSISNLFVSFFFAAFGQWAKKNEIDDIVALFIAMAIPVFLLVCFRLFIAYNSKSNTDVTP